MARNTISLWLTETNRWTFNVYTMAAAFMTYSCMYAFRKPFVVATYEGIQFLGMDFKIWLITSQLTGYALSKFIGIKVISEMGNHNRGVMILILIGIAEMALLLFALSPSPWNIIFLLLNGLPLGMVWGVVFSYIEGRRTTELLGAGLCASFIFSSGLVKSVGKWLMLSFDVSEFWMPFLTGAVFALPLILSVWMLDRVPPPTKEDIRQRLKRSSMGREERWRFFKRFSIPLVLLILVYMLLTVFRDFRDNFSAEMWQTLGYGNSPEIFTVTEVPIAVCVLITMSLVMFIKNNRGALMVNHLIVFFGLLVVGASTFVFERELINEIHWMILIGIGLYLGYVPFNSIFFDRLIASFRYVANVGFLIYLADSFGYLTSVVILLYKNFGRPSMYWLDFFVSGAYILSFAGMFLILVSMIVFQSKFAADEKTEKEVSLYYNN